MSTATPLTAIQRIDNYRRQNGCYETGRYVLTDRQARRWVKKVNRSAKP
jgi:hypothetical protein